MHSLHAIMLTCYHALWAIVLSTEFNRIVIEDLRGRGGDPKGCDTAAVLDRTEDDVMARKPSGLEI